MAQGFGGFWGGCRGVSSVGHGGVELVKGPVVLQVGWAALVAPRAELGANGVLLCNGAGEHQATGWHVGV